MDNVSVSNSAAVGLEITDSVGLTGFSKNRFYGNAAVGLSVQNALLSLLDRESDYIGIAALNGDPVIQTERLTLGNDDSYTIPNLGAPIRFGSETFGSITANGDSTLTIEAGAELDMPVNTGIRIDNRAQLIAQGTGEMPIIIASEPTLPWGGIRLVTTMPVLIDNLVIANSAGVGDQFPGAIAISDFSNVTASNVSIDTTADWGIYCRTPQSEIPVLNEIDAGNANLGAIHPDCGG